MAKSQRRKRLKLHVEVFNPHGEKVDVSEIKNVASRVWRGESKSSGQIKIVLVKDEYITQLNRRFLGKNTSTDVLAFPYNRMNAEPFEGEIYISVDRVLENSERYHVEFRKEISRVVAHGLLHFLGYEDKTRAGKKIMKKREDYYLQLAVSERN
jgi:rRNA maturation RNase YbeY